MKINPSIPNDMLSQLVDDWDIIRPIITQYAVRSRIFGDTKLSSREYLYCNPTIVANESEFMIIGEGHFRMALSRPGSELVWKMSKPADLGGGFSYVHRGCCVREFLNYRIAQEIGASWIFAPTWALAPGHGWGIGVQQKVKKVDPFGSGWELNKEYVQERNWVLELTKEYFQVRGNQFKVDNDVLDLGASNLMYNGTQAIWVDYGWPVRPRSGDLPTDWWVNV